MAWSAFLAARKRQEKWRMYGAHPWAHPGSMATVHADSAAGAVEQIALLILQGGTRLTRQDVLEYVRNSIGVFIQLARVGGRRYVSEVVCT